MNGFPSCLKEVNIKFHVIDALYNKGMAGIEVKAKTAEGEKTKVTDEGGFAPIGPFVPGEAITVDVAKDGYDAVSQTLTADENVDFDMVGLNPTSSEMRLILTWGPTPSDLDSRIKFFDASGDEICKLYWNNKKCDDYASLDVDVSNGGDNGPETITIKNVPEGVKVLYYVYDYSNKIGRDMTWSQAEAKATVWGPNGGGSHVVPLAKNDLNGERYYTVGCFDSTGYASFQKVANSASSPTLSNCP